MKESTQSAMWGRWLAALTVLSFALVWVSGARAQTVTDPSTVRFMCGSATTSACTASNSGAAQTYFTTDTSPTLQFTEQSGTKYTGEAFLVVLVPDTESSSLNFTVSEGSKSLTVTTMTNTFTGSTSNGYNGKLFSTSSGTGFLGVTQSGAVPAGSFSSFTPISDSVMSTSVTGYTVYVVDLGSYSGTPITFSFGGSALPTGTVLWGFVANSGCTISSSGSSTCTGVDGMPYSDTITESGGTPPNPPTVTPEPATLVLLGAGLLLIGLIVRRERFV